MTEEERLERRKDYRKYLRVREGITGADLDAVVRAAERYVPEMVCRYYLPDFVGLLEETLDLRQLLSLINRIERDEQVLAIRQGYACLRAIKGYAHYFAEKNGLNIDDYQPEEDAIEYPIPGEDLPLHEGSEYEYRGIRYERDREARRRCIEYYGCRCQVCGMSFEERYGVIGQGFIEVHHLVPVSERGGEYVVDPIKDLVPLCSNCHSMIHRQRGLSIMELKRQFETAAIGKEN